MLQQQLLITVVEALNDTSVDYMLTGSVVSSMLGEPRSTHDIDIVIVTLKQASIKKLQEIFTEPRFYLDEASIIDALKHRQMFNIIDTESGYKVDFWILNDNEYDVERFARRISKKIYDKDIYITSPEDIIIGKLKWSKLSGGSEKQLKDARSVYQVQQSILDMKYLERWIQKLELQNEWTELKKLSKPIL